MTVKFWRFLRLYSAGVVMLSAPLLRASVTYYSGNLRTDANVIGCGSGCTLDGSNTDDDYGQWAAVVYTFNVVTTTPMEAITYSFGGGTSLTGTPVAAGGSLLI